MSTAFGFVGLGAMGAPMIEAALEKGIAVHVHDADSAAVARLVARGAVAAPSPKALADAVAVVFVSLPTPPIVEAVALGADGLIHGSAIRHYIDLSTIGPTMARSVAKALAAKGIGALDAPVSGGPIGIVNKTLAVMTAGPRATFEAAKPFLDAFTKVYVEISDEAGQAQVVKLANNILTATNMVAVAEAMAFAEKGGIDPEALFKVINAGSGRSWVSEVAYPKHVVTRRYDQQFRTELMHKDATLCLEEADRAGVPMLLCAATRQMWQFMMTQGMGKQDCSRVAELVEGWAGIEPKAAPDADTKRTAA